MEKYCIACPTVRHSKVFQEVFYLSLFTSFTLQFFSCVSPERSHLMPILSQRMEEMVDIWGVA